MEQDRFNRYEENFLNSTRIVRRSINQLDQAKGNVDSVISTVVDMEGELSEAEGYLRAMDIEFRSMATSDKRSSQQKVTEYREELRNLHNSFQTSKANAEALALKSSSSARTKLINLNQKLDASTATLEKSRAIIADTENIGDQIITDMESQKEKLQDAKEKVKDTKSLTSEARRVLRTMGYRNVMHKICVACTIVILFGAIVGIGYWVFASK